MTVYKVVRKRNDGKLVSALNYGRTLRYALGRKTVPVKGDGPLAAFGSREAAQDFLSLFIPGDHPGDQRIFKATGKKSRRETLWYMLAGDGKRRNEFSLPSGTILCDSIILREME